MQTWATLNQKGGSGKTSLTVNVAAALAERGKTTLVVDLDPQAAASAWFGVRDDSRAFLEVFTDGHGLGALVQRTPVEGVDLIPASSWLVSVERAVGPEPGAETILRRAVSKLGTRWDLVLFDCPPSLSLLSVSALVAATGVVVPVTADAMALGGLAGLLSTIDRVKERLNDRLEVAAIVACRVDSRTRLAGEVVEDLRRRFPKLVTKTTIRESVRVREAWSFAKPVTLYAPSSGAAADYRELAGELLPRLRRS